ncbi:MAG: response regulator [Ferrovum sp.]|jgi:two-component system chemotaxis response regulator CheY|nr:response regulator [Ferrovum sp.]
MNKNTLHRFLVVDDFSLIRRWIRESLMSMGFHNVDEAPNGIEALEKLHLNHYALVITDWNMPLMSGIELIENIKHKPELAHLPILMITTEQDQEHISEALTTGADEYLIKPFSQEALRDSIERLVIQS